LRRGHPLLRRSRAPRPRVVRDRVADGVGAARLRVCRGGREFGREPNGKLPLHKPAKRRGLVGGPLHRYWLPPRLHDSLSPLQAPLPPPRTRTTTRKADWMKFPLASTISIGKYVASQQRKGQRYPLVLMLEPTLACNIACIGCGKIREYESNRARLTVEECVDSGVQCPAPVVSICGGEPLVYKGI